MLKSVRSTIKKTPFLGKYMKFFRRTDDRFQNKICSDTHNSVALFHESLPIPPIRFRDMVRKGAILAEDFILEGQQVYDAVTDVIREAGGCFDENTRVFEFGVGCGRVARHFVSDGINNFIGTDVDPDLIQWCNANLILSTKTHFLTNAYDPPLPLGKASLDVGYAISVFTHMKEDNQRAWAEELARVMAPEGLLFVSFLERNESELPRGIAVLERRDPEYSRVWLGRRGAPEVYFNTYTTKTYMVELFAEHFDLVTYAKKLIRNHQSAIVLKRK